MRTFVAVFVLAAATPVFADDKIAGTYDVTFEETASTCNPKPETLSKSKLVIAVKKAALTVKIDALYPMVGTRKNGTISAKTTKPIGTAVGGLSARYSVVGQLDGGALELALTAQYVRQDTYRPHCAQTWKVSGSRR